MLAAVVPPESIVWGVSHLSVFPSFQSALLENCHVSTTRFSGGLPAPPLALPLHVVSWLLQLHANQGSEAHCDAQGKLQIRQDDLLSIFVTSTAEMPGMLFASLLVDFIGRKR